MILDERTEFADATSVVNAAGTILVGDVIDSTVARDLGQGQPVYWMVTVDTEITAAAPGTIEFRLVSDAQAAIATDGSATVHAATGTIVTNVAASNSPLLNAGSVVCCIALPIQGAVYERYLGVLAIIGTTATNAGKVNSFLTLDPTGWKAYADAVN